MLRSLFLKTDWYSPYHTHLSINHPLPFPSIVSSTPGTLKPLPDPECTLYPFPTENHVLSPDAKCLTVSQRSPN